MALTRRRSLLSPVMSVVVVVAGGKDGAKKPFSHAKFGLRVGDGDSSFLPAAKPSDLGTLGVVVVVVGPLLELSNVQFFRGMFKSCQIFNIISKSK